MSNDKIQVPHHDRGKLQSINLDHLLTSRLEVLYFLIWFDNHFFSFQSNPFPSYYSIRKIRCQNHYLILRMKMTVSLWQLYGKCVLNWQIRVSIIKIFKIKNLNHGRGLDLIQNNVFRNVSNPIIIMKLNPKKFRCS